MRAWALLAAALATPATAMVDVPWFDDIDHAATLVDLATAPVPRPNTISADAAAYLMMGLNLGPLAWPEPADLPPQVLPPWADATELADLLQGGALVRSGGPGYTYSGTVLDGNVGKLAFTLGPSSRQSLLGTNSYTGATVVSADATLIATGMASPSVSVAAHGRLYITTSWSPPASVALSIGADGYTAGLIVVTGTLTRPTGGTLAVTGTPATLPQRLVVATSLSGTWTAGTLPAGTRLDQSATEIWLRSNP